MLRFRKIYHFIQIFFLFFIIIVLVSSSIILKVIGWWWLPPKNIESHNHSLLWIPLTKVRSHTDPWAASIFLLKVGLPSFIIACIKKLLLLLSVSSPKDVHLALKSPAIITLSKGSSFSIGLVISFWKTESDNWGSNNSEAILMLQLFLTSLQQQCHNSIYK